MAMSSSLITRKISPQFSFLAARDSDSVISLVLYISTIVLWYLIASPTTIQITIGILAVLAITTLFIKDLFTMSSPKAPRTPLKPTDKANGTPKSPDSIKKMTSTQPDAGNVVKRRVPSQKVKADTTTPNNAVSPQTPRPKPPKSLEDQLPQSPTPDRSSKRQPTTDAPPPKFKAATSGQGNAAKTAVKKVKKTSPPVDVETAKRDHVDGTQSEVKRVKKQAPQPLQEPNHFQNDVEKRTPKFKAPDLDFGETPKSVKKKKPAPPPPELEQEPEREYEAVSDHDEVEHKDNEDEENKNNYHEESGNEEEPELGYSEEEGHNEAGSDWDGEHEPHDDDIDEDYEGHSEGGHGYVTDGEQDMQNEHSDSFSAPLGSTNDEANNPAPISTNNASKPTKGSKHKEQKITPVAGGTTGEKVPGLLEDLVAKPDAVFGDDTDTLDVSQVDVRNGDGDAKGAGSSRVAGNSTVLQSGGGGGIGITANGIEINVQTTKEGTSVTIKIPGASQQ
ncbi:hypothetical protein V499_04249 [Pseudogymnoascus sp. VKM F-103]|nr:hypothetical protein V499_04249 [Pseudogymnoascus sp. VKM F-103]